VQYAHVPEPLELWDVQTSYAGRPWAVEMPSAGRPLSFSQLGGLQRRGIRVARLTHAAGLSATGVPEVDARLPLPERYHLPALSVETIEAARRGGGRIVAAGTSVVRALEDSAARFGRLRAGDHVAELVLGELSPRRVADGLLTGMHPPGTTHFELMTAFAPRPLLGRAVEHAARAGYLEHEFGDAALILPVKG
jgi:S-adenosylmethionine:tRNA ribosyltransferase-isomerase